MTAPGRSADTPGPGTRSDEKEVRPRDIAAEAVGLSEPTYRRIKQAIETAEDAAQPETVRQVARRLEALEKPKASARQSAAAESTNEKRWSDRLAPNCAKRSDDPAPSAHSSHYKVSDVIGPAVGLSACC